MKLEPTLLATQLKGLERPAIPDMAPTNGAKDTEAGKPSFAEFLKTSVENVNKLGLESEQMVKDTLLGKVANPHSTMIALQKADISFRLMLAVKQRLEMAYRELSRTQI